MESERDLKENAKEGGSNYPTQVLHSHSYIYIYIYCRSSNIVLCYKMKYHASIEPFHSNSWNLSYYVS